jgi:hypothetical protein
MFLPGQQEQLGKFPPEKLAARRIIKAECR